MRGFTLIETIIYTALISIIIGGALVTVYQVLESNNALYNKIIVEQEANFLLRKFAWALSGVSAINLPVVGATSSVLSINKINFPENPLVFNLNATDIRLKRGSQEPVILNAQNVKITNLVFQHLASVGNGPEAIKINLTVDSQTFSTVIYLRK
jgi:type II secretory pathway pseudopilin PulG